VPIERQVSATRAFIDLVPVHAEMERILSSRAEIQTLDRKSLNEAQRLPATRKPCRPDLNRHATRMFRTTASPRVHQQITKPPSARAIRQSQAQEPNFVAPPHPQRGVNFVQGLHAIHRQRGRDSGLSLSVAGAAYFARISCPTIFQRGVLSSHRVAMFGRSTA